MAAPFTHTGWAKTVTLAGGIECVYSLVDHLLDTAAVALLLWDRYLTSNQRAVICRGLCADDEHARRLVGFWAGLHDVGKLVPSFQRHCELGWEHLAPGLRADAGHAESVYHDVAGLRSAPAFLVEMGYDFGEDGAYDDSPGWAVAQIIGGHHGLFHTAQFDQECVGECALSGFGGDQWGQARAAHAAIVHEVLGKPAAPQQVSTVAAVLVTGVVMLADWLVSQEHFLRDRVVEAVEEPAAHFAASLKAGEALLAEAGLDASEFAWKPFDFTEHFGLAEPNLLQGSLLETLPSVLNGPGILVATMLMGDGKTELALAAQYLLSQASGTDGFFLGLPTMATSDHMYPRTRAYAERSTLGPAAVSLAHSMAGLNPAYAAGSTGSDLLSPGVEAGLSGRTAAPEWLFGSKRPLLARISTGTIDQALAAVLPVRHNALRLLALSGRTLIVDEAHAYDPYMQVLLERLLTWLGAFGTPVVLLSATLPESTVDRLVRAYLRGAGWKPSGPRERRRQLPTEPYRVRYPGWIYVDAATAAITAEPCAAAREQHSEQRRVELGLEMREVVNAPYTAGMDPQAGERLAEIDGLLGPLIDQGGTAAIVCTTVDEAQDTYQHLRQGVFKERPAEELVLLHARFPAEQRDEATSEIVARLGRTGPRPQRLVVVATAIVEQSLDLDVDVLISDLAPISLLLQRAGRCWRHERYWTSPGVRRPRERPEWCRSGPRLITLVPVDDKKQLGVPWAWGLIYHPYLLVETARLLDEYHGTIVTLPGQVQELVERVYGAGSRFAAEVVEVAARDACDGRSASRSAWDGEQLAQRQIADCVVVNAPQDVGDLSMLSARDFPDSEVGTRLGADSARVLPVYLHAGDRITLDADGTIALPVLAPGARRFSRGQVRSVMARTIPCAERYLTRRGPETNPPSSWARRAWLGDLVLLPHQRDASGAWTGPRIGSRTLTAHPELGLVIRG